jgi:hypothetical protein
MVMAAALLLAALPAGAATGPERVDRIELLVPPGEDYSSAFQLVKGDQGAYLDESLVDRHVEVLGRLGWVDTVEVDVRPARAPDRFDLFYRLLPRDQVKAVRIEGSRALSLGSLEPLLASRTGQTFNLRKALDDAHQINLAYRDAGYTLCGVLDSRNVRFEDGVLTFQVAESRLADEDRERLERALGRPVEPGALTRTGLSRLLASVDLRGFLGPGELVLDLDRLTGELRLPQASD